MVKKKKWRLFDIICRIISSILLLNIVNSFRYNFKYDLSFLNDISLQLLLLLLGIIFVTLSIITLLIKREWLDYFITNISLVICSFLWINNDDIFFIVVLFAVFLLLYKFKPDDLAINFKFKKIFGLICLAIGIMLFCTLSIAIFRYLTFNSPNFDLGIPGQNFYYLKKVGIPLSTCERDHLLSHFAIHISPIYYVILPIYLVFSHVITLQVISALLVTSAIIPIYLLCKKQQLLPIVTAIICLLYSIYAPAICGLLFDFHENMFLLPLLLWLFYFYSKNNNIGILITSLLVLIVKEDSSIYLTIFGIFAIFDKKPKYGIPLVIISVLYFITAVYILNAYGEGVMADRYDNLIGDNTGLYGIIKTIIGNPGYFLKQLFTSNDGNLLKIKYFIQLLLPLGFIPLLSNKKHNYILLLPLIINLMSNYECIYSINFHYNYGVIAFLLYLFIINIKSLNLKEYLIICFIGGLLMFKTYAYPKIYDCINNYFSDRTHYQEMQKTLDAIPSNATVSASTFLIPHLVNRDVIYEVFYHNDVDDIDYVVFDTLDNEYYESYQNYLNNGYVNSSLSANDIIILERKK